jgi:hypothetical protein
MKTKKNSDWVTRLVANRPFTDSEAWQQVQLVRCALQRLLDGEAGSARDEGRPFGNRNDIGVVGYALNVAWWRSKKLVDRACMQLLEAAGQALSECEARGDPAGIYNVSAQEKERVCAGVNVYEAVLRDSSVLQWADAEADFIAQFAEARTAA